MKNKIYVTLLIVLVLCFGSFVARSRSTPVGWEYKFENGPTEKKTNELATQGWELVLIESAGGHRITPTYVFRRVK